MRCFGLSDWEPVLLQTKSDGRIKVRALPLAHLLTCDVIILLQLELVKAVEYLNT